MAGPVRIGIRAPVHPTEDPSLVERAVKSIFPDAVLSCEKACLAGTSRSYDRFVELLARYRIRDTARQHIRRYEREGVSVFFLSKQAASAGRVNFCGQRDEPLGAIEVRLEISDWDVLYGLLSPPIDRSKLVRIEEDEGSSPDT